MEKWGNPDNNITEIDWRWLVKFFIYSAAYIILLIALSVIFPGCARYPQVIVHKYDDYAVNYQTIYGSAWDDPTLVIFKNDSYRKVRIEIDGQKPIILNSYSATANLYFGIGEHQVRLVIEKPTAAHGTWEVIRFLKISIQPWNRSQIISFSE
ncbi:MAG: hypothetical protein AAB696_01515 [Patescibacteria group bacterium]